MFALLATITFFVHGLVDYFFEFTPTLNLWWLLLALAGGISSDLRHHNDAGISLLGR